jgi:uncharacterized protein YjiS (DUF1127 family)
MSKIMTPNADFAATLGASDPIANAMGKAIYRLVNAVNWVVTFPSRQAVKAELSLLSDRELADIGLTRRDISNLYRAGIARRAI